AEGEVDFSALAGTLVASLACEAAVVKHTLLPLEAMRELVRRLRAAREPHRCPHGRPIALKYDLAQLERAFKRR
ncbi:MAG: DNA mismatch repair protein MutL, partial [Chloroflexi bacterium]